MGAWDELDTEINVELDTSEIETAIELCDEYFTEEIREKLSDIKTKITEKSKELSKKVGKRVKSLQELMIGLNGTIASGDLLNSITVEEQTPTSYLVGTNITHFYPLCVEKGRNEVRPIDAPFLQWQTLSGNWVRTMYSRPAKPRPFVEPAYNQTLNEIDDIADEVFNDLG